MYTLEDIPLDLKSCSGGKEENNSYRNNSASQQRFHFPSFSPARRGPKVRVGCAASNL